MEARSARDNPIPGCPHSVHTRTRQRQTATIVGECFPSIVAWRPMEYVVAQQLHESWGSDFESPTSTIPPLRQSAYLQRVRCFLKRAQGTFCPVGIRAMFVNHGNHIDSRDEDCVRCVTGASRRMVTATNGWTLDHSR